MFLNNQQVTEKSQKGNQKISRNKWQWKQDDSKPMGCSKSILRGTFVAIESYLRKRGAQRIDNITLHLKQLEKEQKKPTLVKGKKY